MKKKILFYDEHWIIMVRFMVSHRRPRCKDILILEHQFSFSPLCDSYQEGRGYKFEEKLHLGVREQKKVEYLRYRCTTFIFSVSSVYCKQLLCLLTLLLSCIKLSADFVNLISPLRMESRPKASVIPYV
jgi:hypothetical protein